MFGVNVGACALLLVLVLRQIPRDRPPKPTESFDAVAAVLSTGAVALLVFALIEGRGLGWTSLPVLGALTAAALLGAAGAAAYAGRHRADEVSDTV